jgi:hypothetical protein
VITEVGGTLGLTSAYGVSDPTITRKRVEADLAVFRDYQKKYIGMLEACKEQLNWGVEKYAQIPNPPELLELQPVPPFWTCLWQGLLGGFLLFFGASFCVVFCGLLVRAFIEVAVNPEVARTTSDLLFLIPWCLWAYVVFSSLLPYFRARVANGNRPLENARRQKLYEEAVARALKAAEPVKAAQDYRLRCQIRELEGLIKTVGEKEAEVRRILETL